MIGGVGGDFLTTTFLFSFVWFQLCLQLGISDLAHLRQHGHDHKHKHHPDPAISPASSPLATLVTPGSLDFDEAFNSLKDYYVANGHSKVPQKEMASRKDGSSFSLGKWVQLQRFVAMMILTIARFFACLFVQFLFFSLFERLYFKHRL